MTPKAIQINGEKHFVDVAPDMPLLWVIRDIIGLTGTKYGCGIGQCGACTVHLDGRPTRSCTIPFSAVKNRSVTTIEGLSKDGSHPVQIAWIQEDVPQCGYCQAGQIMTATALLAKNPKPTDKEITTAMSANLCRCGTYQRIHRAVKKAVSISKQSPSK